MKNIAVAATAVALATTSAHAGGIDRSGQGLGALFEKGRYLELSFGMINPTVSGRDVALQPSGNVARDYTQLGLSYKYDVNSKVSFALNIDQPFGANVSYALTSPVLGGTEAVAKATAITGLVRYKVSDNFSVHGGLRAQRSSANVTLSGLAYGAAPPFGLNGYNVTLDADTSAGYVIGVAYEKPEIALRIALTYNSKITHTFATRENIVPGVTTQTKSSLPQSVNLDFQSGVAKDTLVFGQIRWADWSEFKLSPIGFATATGGGSLVNLDDSVTYTLGVGRRFNEHWSGSVSFQYEKKGDPLVSPLAPTNGRVGITLAGVYTKENMKITAGVNYTKVGDAQPETLGVARANMSGGKSVSFGLKVGYSF